MRLPDPAFWARQRVFLTGHTGFKGGWLAIWLHALGATLRGYALEPDQTPHLFGEAGIAQLVETEIADIRDIARLIASLAAFRPTVIFHLAAQPLVRRSYREPVATFATNVLGTVNLLEAARRTPSVGAVVVATTDKCYENTEADRAYREDDRLGGRDPYSASKACAEIATAAYHHSFFRGTSCGLATVRAGNVIGGGDWSEERLVPDLARAFGRGEPALIRSPAATRPWQHVLEPLAGYLLVAEMSFGQPATTPSAWNFGPDPDGVRAVMDVARLAAEAWGVTASVAVRRDPKGPHEARLLALDNAKAKRYLDWAPRWDTAQAMRQTMFWYRAHGEGADALRLCRLGIAVYSARISGAALC